MHQQGLPQPSGCGEAPSSARGTRVALHPSPKSLLKSVPPAERLCRAGYQESVLTKHLQTLVSEGV